MDESLAYENMRKALALLTAWNESDHGDTSLVARTASAYLGVRPDTQGVFEEATGMIGGLISISGRLLIELARATNKSEAEILQIMGQRIAQED